MRNLNYFAYPYQTSIGWTTLYKVWVNGLWDENKYILDEMIVKYPNDDWNYQPLHLDKELLDYL